MHIGSTAGGSAAEVRRCFFLSVVFIRFSVVVSQVKLLVHCSTYCTSHIFMAIQSLLIIYQARGIHGHIQQTPL